MSSTFSTWEPFGGIDAALSDDGNSVLLDTHDTTDTWSTKWSGITLPGPAACSLDVTLRVRDVSHNPGVPGGYGIGLATVKTEAGEEVLHGAAVQYDFGQRGFRLAEYPSDGDFGLIAASLDNGWHTIHLSIDNSGDVFQSVDGVEVVRSSIPPVCGQPTIRVWAGAAQFADFVVEPG